MQLENSSYVPRSPPGIHPGCWPETQARGRLIYASKLNMAGSLKADIPVSCSSGYIALACRIAVVPLSSCLSPFEQ